MAQYNQNAFATAALSELLKNVRLPTYGKMQTFTIQPSEYTIVGDRAQVSPQVLSRMGITPQGTSQQPLRQAVESAGGIVRWQGQGQPIQAITGSRLLDMIRQQASALGAIAALNRPNIPAGTSTLAARQLAEQQRQFDEEMKYRWAALAATKSSGGGGGGSASLYDILGKTAGERANIFTSQALNSALAQYKQNVASGLTHPLEATLTYVFTHPDMVQAGSLGGADLPAVADYLAGSVAGKDYLSYAGATEKQILQRIDQLRRSTVGLWGSKNDPRVDAEIKALEQRLKNLHRLDAIYKSMKTKGSTTLDQPL